MKSRIILCVMLLTLALAHNRHVAAIPLVSLLPGGDLFEEGFKAGDKKFFGWNILSSNFSDFFLEDIVDAVDINPLFEDPLNPGFGFDISGEAFTAAAKREINFDFIFDVKVLVPERGIIGSVLELTDWSITPTQTKNENNELIQNEIGEIKISEIIRDADGNTLLNESVSVSENSEDTYKAAEFPPQPDPLDFISVELDILLARPPINDEGEDEGIFDTIPGKSALNSFEITFSQQDQAPEQADQTNPVPEPATLLLLGSGLACLWGIRRRIRN